MKLEEFKDLEKKIKGQDFNQNYKNIDKVMFYLSIFGHVASIFLAYFFFYQLLNSVIENSIASSIASIIILVGIELIKRDIFNKWSIEYLKYKKLFAKEVAVLTIASATIIGISFSSSIKGAKEFSSKTKKIETAKKESVNTYKDSLNNAYSLKIKEIESETKSIKDKYELKDKEQAEIESNPTLTRTQKSRVKDLKADKLTLKDDIKKNDDKIASLNKELEEKVTKYKDEVSSETDVIKEEGEKNSFLFIVISTAIELFILIGIFFNEFYKWKSYNDFKDKINKDENYQKWFMYNSIMESIYLKDVKVNDRLPSNKAIMEFCRINGVNVIKRDVDECIKVLVSLKIIRNSGSAKYISKEREVAIDLLKNNFRIE